MPRCTICNYQWKVKEIVSLGISNNGKDCLHCGHRQYISVQTQRFFTLGYVSLLFVPILLFRIQLSDKDEPLW